MKLHSKVTLYFKCITFFQSLADFFPFILVEVIESKIIILATIIWVCIPNRDYNGFWNSIFNSHFLDADRV